VRTDDVWLDSNHDGIEDEEAAEVRRLEVVTQARFGCGMSYTFLVPPRGRDVYQGHTMGRVGAHTLGHNGRGRAICLIGNYELHEMTNGQITAVAETMVVEHRAGRHRSHRLNGGHSDAGSQTACPGVKARRRILEINNLAEYLWQGDDVDEATLRLIRETHHEVTQRLPNRSLFDKRPDAAKSDTVLGAALNAWARADETYVEVNRRLDALPDIIRREVATALKAEQPAPKGQR
jgi:hypothetical protein